MDWIDWAATFLFIWVLCALFFHVVRGTQDRRRCIAEGARAGSLWYHINQAHRHRAEETKVRPSKQPASSSTTPNTANSKITVVFMYEDAEGNLSTREVRPTSDDGIYLKGFCYAAGEQRTFRRDRILSVISGEQLLKSAAPVYDQPRRQAPKAIEILFTGFSEDDRQDLELDAELNDMKVRKSVTRNLTFVCAGPNAGPRKLAEARAQGCQILTEYDFHRLLETGEVPA